MDKYLYQTDGSGFHLLQESCTTVISHKRSLYIGLGGAGIRWIRQMKKDLGTLNGMNVDVRFLAIDTDERDLEQLENKESLYIGDPELTPSHMDATDARREVGRQMYALNKKIIRYRLESIVLEMEAGAAWNSIREIYVCFGMRGGTGSAIALPVCYLLRDILQTHGLYHTRIIAYMIPDYYYREFQNPVYSDNYLACKEEWNQVVAGGDPVRSGFSDNLSNNTSRIPVDLTCIVAPEMSIQRTPQELIEIAAMHAEYTLTNAISIADDLAYRMQNENGGKNIWIVAGEKRAIPYKDMQAALNVRIWEEIRKKRFTDKADADSISQMEESLYNFPPILDLPEQIYRAFETAFKPMRFWRDATEEEMQSHFRDTNLEWYLAILEKMRRGLDDFWQDEIAKEKMVRTLVDWCTKQYTEFLQAPDCNLRAAIYVLQAHEGGFALVRREFKRRYIELGEQSQYERRRMTESKRRFLFKNKLITYNAAANACYRKDTILYAYSWMGQVLDLVERMVCDRLKHYVGILNRLFAFLEDVNARNKEAFENGYSDSRSCYDKCYLEKQMDAFLDGKTSYLANGILCTTLNKIKYNVYRCDENKEYPNQAYYEADLLLKELMDTFFNDSGLTQILADTFPQQREVTNDIDADVQDMRSHKLSDMIDSVTNYQTEVLHTILMRTGLNSPRKTEIICPINFPAITQDVNKLSVPRDWSRRGVEQADCVNTLCWIGNGKFGI